METEKILIEISEISKIVYETYKKSLAKYPHGSSTTLLNEAMELHNVGDATRTLIMLYGLNELRSVT